MRPAKTKQKTTYHRIRASPNESVLWMMLYSFFTSATQLIIGAVNAAVTETLEWSTAL